MDVYALLSHKQTFNIPVNQTFQEFTANIRSSERD